MLNNAKWNLCHKQLCCDVITFVKALHLTPLIASYTLLVHLFQSRTISERWLAAGESTFPGRCLIAFYVLSCLSFCNYPTPIVLRSLRPSIAKLRISFPRSTPHLGARSTTAGYVSDRRRLLYPCYFCVHSQSRVTLQLKKWVLPKMTWNVILQN